MPEGRVNLPGFSPRIGGLRRISPAPAPIRFPFPPRACRSFPSALPPVRLLTWVLPLLFLALAGTRGTFAQGGGRVVMLGFDGADARTLDQLRKASPDAFPNVNRLADTGSFEPLLVEAPPESPVSWAALNTGQNPGKTGVPGFVKRTFLGDVPGPDVGHIVLDDVPLSELEGAPIPTWSPTVFAIVFGGAAFLLLFLFLKFLLRRSVALSAILALLVGGGAAWGGMQVRALLPESLPKTSNPNQARNFWDFAADGGKRCVVLGAAQAFDMPSPPGAKVLSGLGVPDARGEIGNWFLYTTNPKESGRQPKGRKTTTSGYVYRLDDYDGEVEGFVYGPKNFWLTSQLETRLAAVEEEYSSPSLPLERSIELSQERTDLKRRLKDLGSEATSLPLHIVRDSEGATVKIGEQSQRLEVGAWSDFYELTFEINALISVHAITRARLIQVEPHFELFLDVLAHRPAQASVLAAVVEPAERTSRASSFREDRSCSRPTAGRP